MNTPTTIHSTPARLEAVTALSHSPSCPGVTWNDIEAARPILARIELGQAGEPVTFTATELDLLCGLLNGLDWLTDLAEEAGVLDRGRKST